MRILFSVPIVAALVVIHSTANGQIKVEYFDGSGSFEDRTTNINYVIFENNSNASGSDLELLDQGDANGRYRVTTQFPSTNDIGIITYNGTSGIQLLVADVNGVTASQVTRAAEDWAGLIGTGGDNIYLQVSLNGLLTGDVTTGRFTRIDADRGINSGLTITHTTNSAASHIRSTTGGIGADIVFERGSLGNIETHGDFTGSLTVEQDDLENIIIDIFGGGSLLGDVRIENGTIDTIFVEGNIGSPTKPVTIFAGKDVNQLPDPSTINYILCRGDMYANITASDGALKEGQFKRIRANEGVLSNGKIGTGLSDTPRNFTGTIETFTAFEVNDSALFEQIPCIMFNDVRGGSTIQFYDKPHSPITINALSEDSKILIGDRLEVVFTPLEPTMGFPEDSMLFIVDPMGAAEPSVLPRLISMLRRVCRPTIRA